MSSGSIDNPTADAFPWPEQTYRGKRTLDVVVSLVFLIVSAPLMLVIMLAVKTTSAGSVFYKGERCGLGGRAFKQLKFRSMCVHREGGAFTSRGDPRVTSVGRILRLFKMDELPQLINVLRGEMSLVGPRPEDRAVIELYYTPDQKRVLSARPGLTCLLQVRIFPDFCDHVPEGVDPQEHYRTVILPARLTEDMEYVDRMSLWLDLKIIIQTAWCILFKSWIVLLRRRREAADHPQGAGQ